MYVDEECEYCGGMAYGFYDYVEYNGYWADVWVAVCPFCETETIYAVD